MPHPLRSARRRAPFAALVLAFALAACALIPPQPVADPLGLDGQVVPLAPIGGVVPLQARPCPEFAAEATHCAAEEVGARTEDLDAGAVGRIVARFDTEIGTAEAIELIVPPNVEAPASVTISAVALELFVEDVEEGWELHPGAYRAAPAEGARFAPAGDCAPAEAGLLRCPYAADDASALTVPVVVRGGELDTLMRILTSGGENALSGTIAYRIEAEGPPPEGFGALVTLEAPSGTIRF